MIIIDNSKCPMKIDFSYSRSMYSRNDRPDGKEDYLRLEYKDSSIFIRPKPRQIKIEGDIPMIALGVALLVQGTLETLDRTNIIDDAFTFSKDGLINEYWTVDNKDEVREFVNTYNRIYSTVMLLKE